MHEKDGFRDDYIRVSFSQRIIYDVHDNKLCHACDDVTVLNSGGYIR